MNLFTLENIHNVFAKVDNASLNLDELLEELEMLDIVRYQYRVADGTFTYYNRSGDSLSTPAHTEIYDVSSKDDTENFLAHLNQHEKQEVDFLAFRKEMAQAGITHCVTQIEARMVYYYNTEENIVIAQTL